MCNTTTMWSISQCISTPKQKHQSLSTKFLSLNPNQTPLQYTKAPEIEINPNKHIKPKQDKGIVFFFFFLNYTWSCFVCFYMNVNQYSLGWASKNYNVFQFYTKHKLLKRPTLGKKKYWHTEKREIHQHPKTCHH